MESYRKLALILGIFLVLIVVVLFIFTKMLMPKDSVNTGFWATINGEVHFTANDSFHFPNYVYVYYGHPYLHNLDRSGTIIKLANITWEKEIGRYSVSFWTPIEMSVIVTADRLGCNSSYVYTSPKNNIQNIDLLFDGKQCADILSISNNKNQMLDQARQSLDGLFIRSTEPIFILNETEAIKVDVKLGSQEIQAANSEIDEDKSRIHSYNSLFLVQRAFFKISMFELKNCLDEALPYLENDSCITFPIQPREEILQIDSSYNSNWNLWELKIDEIRLREIKTPEEAKNNIIYMSSERDTSIRYLGQCEDSLAIIKKSHINQEPVCKARKINIFLIKWFEALAFVCLGFIIYASLKKWTEK